MAFGLFLSVYMLFWVVLLIFCGLFFGVGACRVAKLFGGGLRGLGCLVFGTVFCSCFC